MKWILGLVVVLFTLHSNCVIIGAERNVAETSDQNQDQYYALNVNANEPIQTDVKTGSFARSNFTTDDKSFKLQSGRSSESKTITGSNYAMRTDSKSVQTITRITPKSISSKPSDFNVENQLPMALAKQNVYDNSQMNTNNLLLNEKEAKPDMYPSPLTYNKADYPNSISRPINLPKIDTKNILTNGRRYINANELKNIFVRKYGGVLSSPTEADQFGDIILPDLHKKEELSPPNNANNGNGGIILPNLHNENSFSTDAKYLRRENLDEIFSRKQQNLQQRESMLNSETNIITNDILNTKNIFNEVRIRKIADSVLSRVIRMIRNITICVPIGSEDCTPIQLGGKDANGNGYKGPFSNLLNKIEKIIKVDEINTLKRETNINKLNTLRQELYDYRRSRLPSDDCNENTPTPDNSLPNRYEPLARFQPTPENFPGLYKPIFVPSDNLNNILKNYAGKTASYPIRFNSEPTSCYNCEAAMSDLKKVIENTADKIVSKIATTEKMVKNIFNLLKIYMQSKQFNRYNSPKFTMNPMLQSRTNYDRMSSIPDQEPVNDGNIETGSFAESSIKTGSGTKSQIASSNFLNAKIQNGQNSGMKMGSFTEESYRNDMGQLQQIKTGAVQNM